SVIIARRHHYNMRSQSRTMAGQEAPINLDGRSEMAELREQMAEMMRMQQERPIAYINHSHPPAQHNPTSQYNQPRPNQYHTPQAKPLNNYQPRPYQANNQNFNRNQPQRAFDPIPVTYAELFAHLQTERVLAPIVGRTPNTAAPWYNPNTSCDYHSMVVGHSTETCRALKHRIQDLIDSKWLEFKDAVPTITGNPLPNHGNQGINVLEQDDVMTIVDKVEGIKTPLKNIFNAMCHHGLVETVEGRVHEDDGFKGGTPSYAAPPRRAPHLYMEAMVTGQPSPFPYQSDKAVPWKYQSDSGAGSGHVDEVVNIAGVGNMTRSGRVYSPVDTPKKIINTSKGGERDVETTEDRTEVEQDDLFPQNESFVRTGFVHPDMVAMVEEYQLEDGTKHVYQCTPGKKLSNWTEEDVASSVYFTM
ncbi:hypothetical protein Lal_00039360, partial [Lupinus albus]